MKEFTLYLKFWNKKVVRRVYLRKAMMGENVSGVGYMSKGWRERKKSWKIRVGPFFEAITEPYCEVDIPVTRLRC